MFGIHRLKSFPSRNSFWVTVPTALFLQRKSQVSLVCEFCVYINLWFMHFYALRSNDLGHTVLGLSVSLSALSVCLTVYLSTMFDLGWPCQGHGVSQTQLCVLCVLVTALEWGCDFFNRYRLIRCFKVKYKKVTFIYGTGCVFMLLATSFLIKKLCFVFTLSFMYYIGYSYLKVVVIYYIFLSKLLILVQWKWIITEFMSVWMICTIHHNKQFR